MNELLVTIGRWFGQFTPWVMVSPWEAALRVRCGRHVAKLSPGFYWRLPLFDVIYKQQTRLRTSVVCTQTLSTRDGATLMIGCVLAYSITDIERLYGTLQHGEGTLDSLTAAAIAELVQSRDRSELVPESIGCVTNKLSQKFEAYGIGDVSVRVTDFAYLRAFRLVQDQRWSQHTNDQLDMMKGLGV